MFIQYNREADGSLRELPAQHVDTGMGFERLTSILQGVDSNYDTDIFEPLFDEIRKVTGAPPYSGRIGADDVGFVDTAYRVVADHVRTLSFAIADGAVPSNDGRGYVLRRVLRRAVRYGRQNLGADLGFFCRLVPKLVEVMGEAFPELVEKQQHVMAIIRDEEESFSRTLDKGLQKFTELADKQSGEDGAAVFSGDDAHFLYTTMGFPVDLTELMAQERGMEVDKAGFEARMKNEQELSAAAHKAKMASGSGKEMDLQAEQTAHLASRSVAGTDDSAKYVWNQDLTGCLVQALYLGRNETEDKIGFVDYADSASSAIGVVLDKTSFYAEAGGQIFDTGLLETPTASIRVTNVQQYGQYILHVGHVESGTVTVGDSITCKVDYVRRAPIASNHTMTHVLNYALREVLVARPERESPGSVTQGVDQKGSLVDESKLRFDFSWNAQLTPDQLAEVERLCVERIEQQVPVDAYVAPLPEAERISSLRAVFGEKYPDPVRVVSVSPVKVTEMLSNPQDATWSQYSVEFCGGTHLTNTKEAEAFCLLSEEGIAKGIRRIVAVTREDAKRAIALASEFEAKMKAAELLEGEALEGQIKVLTNELNSIDISAVRKVAFRERLAAFGKAVVAYKKQKMAGMADEIVEKAIQVSAGTEGDKVVLRFDFGLDGKLGRTIVAAVNKKVQDKAIFLVSADEDSDRFLVVASSPKGVDVDCKAWATSATEGTDAKGGGKKDSVLLNAQGVGSIERVLEKARQY